MAEPSKLPEMLTPVEVATILSMSVESLANWRSQGVGPPFMKKTESTKARVLYRREDLLKWIDDLPLIVPSKRKD
jgi:hypothetical protein